MSSSVAQAESSAVASSPSAPPSVLLGPIERGWQHRRYSILREVLGPDFHGPSSSHTAAPQLIAYEAYQMLGGVPETARVKLVNSFATTGDGHRTIIAVTAGLMGISTTDPRTPIAVVLAAELGVRIELERVEDLAEHPNTLELQLRRGTKAAFLKAISIGGGNFEILEKRDLAQAA